MSKMIVAYVCDERYKPLLEKSMNSVKRYNKEVEFVVLSTKFYQIDGAKVVTFNPHLHRRLFKFKPGDRMQEGVYYKLWLPVLPYDKVLYLDCDTICQRPLNELWEMDCPFICATESHVFGKEQATELGVPRYVISGMMLMNLQALREANFTKKCLDYLATAEEVKWHDETIINKLFNDRIKFIDVKWNYCRNRVYENPIPESDAYILHYVSLRNKRIMQQYDDFKNLEPLSNYMYGRSVAIVGNCSGILTKNQGKEIDSHDVVIRFNKGFPCDAVGHKTTALFLACTLTPEELRRFRADVTVRRSNLCHNRCDLALSTTDRTRFAQVPCEYRRRTLPGHLSQASTGFLAIQFALSTQCKSIDLYGFDFFRSDTYYNPAGYQTLHNGDKEAEKVLEYAKYGLLEIK